MQRADRHSVRCAHAGAQANVNRRIGDIAHGDVADADVREFGAIHGLEREAAGVVKDAVGDRDVAE